MDDELLDAIVASIFLIIVSLIGIYFPYIVTRIFGTHNPYLILEVAGFITYSISEPGNMSAAFLVTNGPVPFHEFRIIPPIHSSALFIPLYNNNDFLVSIGICYEHNFWHQIEYDALTSLITEGLSYLPGLKNFGVTKSVIEALNDIDKVALARQTFIGFVGAYASFTTQSVYSQYSYGNYNIFGDIFNALQSSVGPALWSTVEFSAMQFVDMILDETLPPPFDFIAGFAFNMIFTSAFTIYQYWKATMDPYMSCYYNEFIQHKIWGPFSNGEYTVYQPYMTLSIYYNPNFTFYNGCTDYYLCNISFRYIYNSSDESQDNIFKLDLGNINNKGQEEFPEFIVISKTGLESGGSQYLNISVLSSES